MKSLTLFTFGYSGWGNATSQLVRSIDAAEQVREFAPPVFVDVRASRSVRAVGFRGTAFERQVGADRYRWMSGLGNDYIKTLTGPPLQIRNPADADVLLDLALEQNRQNRRVIFFCSCTFPPRSAAPKCHRYEVARLAGDTARRRKLAVNIQEWPGDSPNTMDLTVSRLAMDAARQGRKNIPVGNTLPLAELAAIPWGSVINLRHRSERLWIVTGPANYREGGWHLPVYDSFGDGHHICSVHSASAHFRNQWQIPTRGALSATRSKNGHFPYCVYTIAHGDKLREAIRSGREGAFREGRRWVTARQFHQQAKRQGNRVPVLFADAVDCSRLTHWGLLSGVTLRANGTTFRVECLRALRNHVPQDLYLLSTELRIAPGFIRPYALCHTPEFLST